MMEHEVPRSGRRIRCLKEDVAALCVVLSILVITVIMAAVSLVPSLGAPNLPSFSEPIKGFEPRGTDLSNSIITGKNLLKMERLSYQPSAEVTQPRERRSKVSDGPYSSCHLPSALALCHDNYENKYVNMVFAFKSESEEVSLFNTKSLKAMCTLADELVKPLACPRFCEFCCDSWSVGNYVALINNRSTCGDITDEDVSATMELISNCSTYFNKEELKSTCEYPDVWENKTESSNCKDVPLHCIKNNAVYNILRYLTDNAFMTEPDKKFLKYAAVIPGISQWNGDFFNEIYHTKLQSTLPSADGVQLVGYKLGNVKFEEFNNQLLADAVFIGIALVFVLVIMCIFLRSILLAFATILCIIFALVLSYFFYRIVFRVTFFPFLNVLAAVFLVGIGADDAFVYYDIWLQMRAAHPDANVKELTLYTLRYAALSMLVTSLTTSAAFFAGLSSSISSIRCFGIFAGMSILTNYLLMITWFPACVALHERWVLKRVVDQQESSPARPREPPDEEAVITNNYLPCWSKFIDFPCGLFPGLVPFFQKLGKKAFEKWLPDAVLKLSWLWIFLFIGLTAGFLCVNLVKPGLRLPTSNEFQVFSSSHPLEQYSLHYKSHFRFESQSEGTGMAIKLTWGVKKADNGDHLDPDDLGTLQMDDTFRDIFSKASQTWLLSLCSSIRKQAFYSTLQGDVCVMEMFQKLCGPCCGNNSFPFPPQVAERCLVNMQGTSSLLFEQDSNSPVGLTLTFPTKRYYTQAYEPMDKFWKEINSWVDEQMSTAPPGLKNGWVCTSWPGYLDFFSLQHGLSQGTFSSLGISVAIAFCIILLTTLNIFISIYAILTIVGIIAITIGSLVLAGWQLNILESIVLSVSVGLSIDFTMHYGVAYRLSPDKCSRHKRVRYALAHIGSAISMAALTTFVTGAWMVLSKVLAYFQLGQFLMLVMLFSWLYATFAFLSICTVVGPVGNFGQLSIKNLCCKSDPGQVDPGRYNTKQDEIIPLEIGPDKSDPYEDKTSPRAATSQTGAPTETAVYITKNERRQSGGAVAADETSETPL